MASKWGGAPKCPRCTQSVYAAEEVLGPNGTKYHKRCFLCTNCGKSIDSTTMSERDGQIYCKACYGKNFGPKGFGYGLGAGALTDTSAVPAPAWPVTGGGPEQKTFSSDLRPSNNKFSAPASDKCPRCEKTVYFAEKVVGAGASWHKLCFSCPDCKKMLDSSTLAEKDGQIYCKSCHGKRFGPKGFGFGLGTMETGM